MKPTEKKNTDGRTNPRLRTLAIAGAAALLAMVSGCAVNTKPFSETDRSDRIESDLAEIFRNQEPLNGPVSLEEAIARALKYNLDHKISLMETAIAKQNIDVSKFDLLPRLAADAGYSHRSNSAGGRSQSLLSGEESLEPSTSQERDSSLVNLQVAWNVLDFGVSYLAAHQTQDEARMVEERRRKVIQNITFEIVNAYSLAWIAQRYGYETESLIDEINDTIESYDRLVKKQLQNPKEALLGQRRLLDTQNQLLQLTNDMAVAKARLSRLMNLEPGREYSLTGPAFDVDNAALSTDISALEMSALANRPELREQDYAIRVSQLEVRKEMLRMFPGLEFNLGGHSDSNKFLFHRSWADTGIRLSWNLLNLVSGPSVRDLRKSEEELAKARRRALSMSVMTQVRLAAQNFAIEQRQLRQAERLSAVDDRLFELIKGAELTRTRFDMIQAKAAWLTSTVRREVARAELHNAIARIMDSLGLDPVPGTVNSHSIDGLEDAIRSRWDVMLGRYFTINSSDPDAPDDEQYADTGATVGRPGDVMPAEYGARTEPVLN